MGSYVLPSVVPKMDVRGAAHKFTSVIWIPNSWKNNHCPVWCLAKWLLRDPHFFKVYFGVRDPIDYHFKCGMTLNYIRRSGTANC